MRILVLAANGKAGRLIVQEALDKGMDVVASSRSANLTQATKYLQKDILNLTKDDLEGYDAIVDCFGAWDKENLPLHVLTIEHICSLLYGIETRLLVVGGSGSLYVNKTHSVRVSDDPNFLEEDMPVASAMSAALAKLRTYSNIKWTYLSPACIFDPQGKRTGKYTLGGEELILNSENKSYISYEDYATAMVDEIMHGSHYYQRISVVGEK